MSAGSSSGLSHTPSGSPRSRICAPRSFQSASGTITGPGGSVARSSSGLTPSVCHTSFSTRRTGVPSGARAVRMIRSGMSGLLRVAVHACLERGDAEAMDGVDEELVLVARVDVGIDQLRDDLGHLGRGERRSDDLSQRGVVALAPADGHLVELRALLVDAEDADVADVMVAAGIHAAGDVEVQLADVVQVIEIVEAALDRLGDGNRLRVGERAEIPAGAADDVGEQAHVGR